MLVKEKTKRKLTHAVRTTAPNFPDCRKNEPPGRNLGITLKINKWALLKETACSKMKSTTYPYHVVPKTKKGTTNGDELPEVS
jgi:hypothetical protein